MRGADLRGVRGRCDGRGAVLRGVRGRFKGKRVDRRGMGSCKGRMRFRGADLRCVSRCKGRRADMKGERRGADVRSSEGRGVGVRGEGQI